MISHSYFMNIPDDEQVDIQLISHQNPIHIQQISHKYIGLCQFPWYFHIAIQFSSRTTSSAACSAALQAQPKGPAAAMAAATANDRKEEGEKSSAPRGVVGKKDGTLWLCQNSYWK